MRALTRIVINHWSDGMATLELQWRVPNARDEWAAEWEMPVDHGDVDETLRIARTMSALHQCSIRHNHPRHTTIEPAPSSENYPCP